MADQADSTSPLGEWIMPREAVALVVRDHGADPREADWALRRAVVAGEVPCIGDIDAYRAADPADLVWPLAPGESLTRPRPDRGSTDWDAGTIRVFEDGTHRSMVMRLLVNRAAVIGWAATTPLVRRAPLPPALPAAAAPPPAASQPPRATDPERLAAVREWMRANVQGPVPWKKEKPEGAVAACMAATGAKRDIVRLAYDNRISDLHLSIRQGRPSR